MHRDGRGTSSSSDDIAGTAAATRDAASFPETYDLREKGVVTPVKLQNPFGTCWGFASIAAAETSILSETGLTYAQTGFDLSEHQLAWFSTTLMPEGDDGQGGEGETGGSC